MSTTMVGDESDFSASTSVDAAGNQMDTKKMGSITAFFQPLPNKETIQSVTEAEPKRHHLSSKGDDTKEDKGETHLLQGLNISNSDDGKETCLKKWTCNLPGGKLSTQNVEKSPDKKAPPKHTRPRWSLTCKVSTSSKLLSDSSSDFEDSGNSSSVTKTKRVQKGGKKKKQSKFHRKDSSDFQDGEKIKAAEPLMEQPKEDESECKRVADEACDDSSKHHTEPSHEDNLFAVANASSEEDKLKRTSAFDIMMNSQKIQRADEQRTENDSVVTEISSDFESKTLHVSKVVEDEALSDSPKSSIGSQVELPVATVTGEKLSSKMKAGSAETSAFDFLMKKGGKGRLGCNPNSVVESEMGSKASENLEALLNRRSKKKSFAFQLSIHGSKMKDVDSLVESSNVIEAADSCQEQESENTTKKARKRKKKKELAVESPETHEEEGEVLKSKKGRGRSKTSNQKGNDRRDGTSIISEKGKTEISSNEASTAEETNQADKMIVKLRTRKCRRKSAQGSPAAETAPDQSPDNKDFEPVTRRARRKSAQQKNNSGNHTDTKVDKVKKERTRGKKKEKTAVSQQLPAMQDGQLLADSTPKDAEEAAIETLKPAAISSSSAESSHKEKDAEGKRLNKDDIRGTNLSKEPKNLASIFLKKKPVPAKPTTIELSEKTDAESSALLSASTAGTETTSTDINDSEQVSRVAESSQSEKKSVVDTKAANSAFKALFAGARLQRAASTSGSAVALPAPWPSVSHVSQKGEAESVDSQLWNLAWPSEKDCKFPVNLDSLFQMGPAVPWLSALFSLKETETITRRKEIHRSYKPQRKSDDKVTPEIFPEAVVKKVLMEMTMFYPGVPLRKLYKRYKAKQEKYKASQDIRENEKIITEKSAPGDALESNVKSSENKDKKEGDEEEKTFGQSRRRGKRKLSGDNGICEERKSARKTKDFLIPSESQGVDQSANHSCKKRGREEQDDQNATKGRRLSTRLQGKKNTLGDSNDANQEEAEAASSRKKRRKTSNQPVEEDKTTTSQTAESEKPFELPAVSESLPKTGVKDTLWTELYRPLCSTEVMANASAVSKLRSWLEEWKIKRAKTLRKELQQQKRLLAKEKSNGASNSRSSGQTLEWWDQDSDSDFQISDASDDSDTEGVGLSTAMFISGPKGAGKTAMVYACAEELGYKVFEVNCASKRSGKRILSQLEEATQSHLVISNKTTAANKGSFPQASFAGLFNKSAENPPSSSPLQACLKPSENTSGDKTKKGGKGKKDKGLKDKKKDSSSKGKGKSILKRTSSQAVGKEETESCSKLSTKAASLILFEEVDIIFEEDKSFWMAVNSFLQNSKCPIVLISTEPCMGYEGRSEHVNLKAPSVNLLSGHLQLVTLLNNMFVNPEDLKSLVALNNCDIRKSLTTLQFWAESGGGVMTQYKRPLGLQEKGNSAADAPQNLQELTRSKDTFTENRKADIGPSACLLDETASALSSGILTDDGEESMFLNLSDWQTIKSRGKSGLATSRPDIPDNNSDSDFCEPKKKIVIGADGSTDSIFEITDTNDSQPVSCSDREADDSSQRLPLIHGLLFESVHGLLNCVADPTTSPLSILQIEEQNDDTVKRTMLEKLQLTHFSQGLGVDVVQSNLSDLLPLFTESSNSLQAKCIPIQSQTTCPETSNKKPEDLKASTNLFCDTSLFDDGTEQSADNENIELMESSPSCDTAGDLGPDEPLKRTGLSSQNSIDTGFSESQPTQGGGEGSQGQEVDSEMGSESEIPSKLTHNMSSEENKWNAKALEVFEQFAENMSFADAFCTNFPEFNTISNSSDLGWWNASLKPGLTDEHVTVQDPCDWLTRDTRASLRGALEVASLENCHVKVISLAESLRELETSSQGERVESHESSVVGKNKFYNFEMLAGNLPSREPKSVLRLSACSETQNSSAVSRKKLYSSLSSCIPALYHCSHRCVVSDYLPTLRLLCHSERLREAANIKRRFLHYLVSNSFPLSRSTMEAVADAYMAS